MSWFNWLFGEKRYDKSERPKSTLVGHTEPKKPTVKIITKTVLENRELPPKTMDTIYSQPSHNPTTPCIHYWNYNVSPAQCMKCGKMYGCR